MLAMKNVPQLPPESTPTKSQFVLGTCSMVYWRGVRALAEDATLWPAEVPTSLWGIFAVLLQACYDLPLLLVSVDVLYSCYVRSMGPKRWYPRPGTSLGAAPIPQSWVAVEELHLS